MIPGISQPAASVTLYHQNFDTDPDPLNFFYAEGVVFPSDYGYAYFHPAGSQPLRLIGFLADDVTAEALFLTTDPARVTVRRSGTDHYSAIMAGSGEVALYRNESVIATGLSTQPYDPLGWRKITLSAEAVTGAAILRVSINDEEIITFSDPQPLAAGNVEFGMVSDGMIDNVQINIPSQETEVSSSAFSAFSTASSGYYPFNVDNLELAFENASDSSILYYDRTEPSVARLNYLTNEQSGTFATFDASAFEVMGEIIPSPDGSQGVYVCRSYSVSTQLLCLADFTTGDVVTIATTIPGAKAPVWSPDGLTILYASPAFPTPELKQIDVTTNTSQSTPLRCIDFDWAGAYIFCLTATALTAYQAGDPDWIPIPVLSGVSLKNFDAVVTYNGIGITYEERTSIPTNAGVITTLGWGNVLTSDMSWVPGNIVTVNTPNFTSFPDGSRLFKWTSYERPTWSPDGRNILYFAVDYSHLCEEENGQPVFCYLVRADKVALYNGLLGSPESESLSSYELTQEQGLLAPDTLFISSFNTYKLFFRWAQVQLPAESPTCTVRIRDVEPERGSVYGFSFDTEENTFTRVEISDRDDIVVNTRLIPDGNVVRANMRENPEDIESEVLEIWFNSGGGNVVNVTEGDCNELVVDNVSSDTLRQTVINILLEYGIETIALSQFEDLITGSPAALAYADTLESQSATNVTTVSDWTSEEIFQILVGVDDIGLAFTEIRPDATAVSAFRQGMGIDLNGGSTARGNIRYIRVSHLPYCVNILNAIPRTTVCGTIARGFSNYLVVHELGHVFDNQADQGGNQSITDALASGMFTIQDQEFYWVMGHHTVVPCGPGRNAAPVGWARGERGWGSGPSSIYSAQGIDERCQNPPSPNFTDFQQNPPPYQVASGLTALEVSYQESAADMFLNWTYRIQIQGGFRNRTWKPNERDAEGYCNRPDGCDDNQTFNPPSSNRNSGDARFNWMNSFMQSTLIRLMP